MEDKASVLETLTEEQQGQVFHLMELANIDNLDFAAQMLIQFNYDVEKAAQQLMGIQSSLDQTNTAQQPDLSVHGHGMNIENQGPQRNRDENDLAVLYRRHLERKEEEEKQNATGNRITNAMNSIMSASKNSQSAGGEEFVNFIRQNYSDLNKALKFNSGTFEEAVQKAAQYKKPLLVYIHDQSPENIDIPREILSQSVLANLINNNFYLIGVLVGSPAAEPLKQHVDIEGCSSLAVFRTNLLDEVVRMETIILSNYTDVLDLQDQLRSVQGTYYMILTEEDKVKSEVRRNIENERRRMEEHEFDYHDEENDFGSHQRYNPELDPVEQARREEDRILRQIQEEEFKEAERKIREKQVDQDKQAILKKEKDAEEQRVRKQREEEQRIREEEKQQQRELKLKRLPAEPAAEGPNVVNILFRTPNGNNLERRFNATDKVQALYDYIDTQDVTFDKATIKYDFIQPRPFLCLDDVNKTLNDYFEGSTHERVQIREHSS